MMTCLAETRRLNVSYSNSIGQLYTEMLLSTAGHVDHARRLLNIIYNQHHSFSHLLLILHLRELLWILSDLSLAVGQENDTFWSCVTMQLGIQRLILSDLSLTVSQENDIFWSCVTMQLSIQRLLPYAQMMLNKLLRN